MKQTAKKRRPARPAAKSARTKAGTTRQDNNKAVQPATNVGNPHAPAQESKKDTVITLLRRGNGATLDELMSATGWQAHSVRGFISGTVRKALGLKVVTERNSAGTSTYRIQ